MMALAPGIRERLLPPAAGAPTRRSQEPQPELVQGVIVTPPREARVSVRVEIVSEGDPHTGGHAAQAWPDRQPVPPAALASEAMLAAVAAELPPPSAAGLGGVDPRRAAAAYFA